MGGSAPALPPAMQLTLLWPVACAHKWQRCWLCDSVGCPELPLNFCFAEASCNALQGEYSSGPVTAGELLGGLLPPTGLQHCTIHVTH